MATTTDQVNDDIAIPTSWSKPYPPTNRDGDVAEHDKPFFYYGHLGIVVRLKLSIFLF